MTTETGCLGTGLRCMVQFSRGRAIDMLHCRLLGIEFVWQLCGYASGDSSWGIRNCEPLRVEPEQEQAEVTLTTQVIMSNSSRDCTMRTHRIDRNGAGQSHMSDSMRLVRTAQDLLWTRETEVALFIRPSLLLFGLSDQRCD